MDKSSSLVMPTHPKKYPRGTSIKAWGCPRGTPSSFLLLHALCIFLGASVVLVFSFVCCNKWLNPNKFLLEKSPCFSFAKNTPFFYSYRFNECSLFLELRLAFDFRLNFCSDIVISFYQGVFFSSGPCWFASKELFQKRLNGVGKEKKLYGKKWYKKELV
jgi:hypothetical protein